MEFNGIPRLASALCGLRVLASYVAVRALADVVDRFVVYAACYAAMDENAAAHRAESASYYRWMANVTRFGL